jgi:hypothetical protein
MRQHAQDLYQENVGRLGELEKQRQNVISFAAELENAMGSIDSDDIEAAELAPIDEDN